MGPDDRRRVGLGSRTAVARLEHLAAQLLGVADVCFAPIGPVPDEPFTAGVLHTGEVRAVDSLGADAPAYLGVPVRAEDGSVVGALRVVERQRAWNETDVALLCEMADAVGQLVGLSRVNRALAADLMTQSAQEDRLRESQQRQRVTFDHAPIAEAVVGLDGRWLEVNPALCRLLDRSPSELQRLTLIDVSHPEDRDVHVVPMARLLEGEVDSYAIEKRYLRRDGDVVWVAVHVALVRDRAGEPVYFIAHIEDVTDRRRRSEELVAVADELTAANDMLTASVRQALASEARYRTLVDHLPDTAVHVFDRDRRVTVSIGSGIAARGFTEGELLGRRPDEVLSPGDAALLHNHLDLALEGTASRFEIRTARSRLDQLVEVVPLDLGRDGPTEEVLVVSRDVTLQKMRERELAGAEARWRAAFEGAPVGIVELTLDGCILRVNPAMCELAGRPVDALEGGDLASLLHEDDGLEPPDWRTAAGDTAVSPVPVERRLVRPDGGLRWVNEHHSMIRNPAGVASHLLMHLFDVTEDHANRSRLEASRARFAALVEHSSDVIAILDAEFVLDYVSPSSRAVFGLDAARMIGSSMLAGVHPEDTARFQEKCGVVIANPSQVMTFDVRTHHTDGTWRTIETTVSNRLADPAVAGLVCNCRDVSDRVEITRRLAHQAMHDHLTGLPNRALILDRLDQAMARADRSGHPCAVLYIDLDRFKQVNDDLGHRGGDQLLIAVAERLRGAVRPGDSVGRIGGDEFVLLADGISDINIALDIAERVRHAVTQPVVVDGETVAVGCSVGIALSDNSRADLLLREADVALYRAKANGRNRWELYEQSVPVLEIDAQDSDGREGAARTRQPRLPAE